MNEEITRLSESVSDIAGRISITDRRQCSPLVTAKAVVELEATRCVLLRLLDQIRASAETASAASNGGPLFSTSGTV